MHYLEFGNRRSWTAKEAVIAETVSIARNVADWERQVVDDFVRIGKPRPAIRTLAWLVGPVEFGPSLDDAVAGIDPAC